MVTLAGPLRYGIAMRAILLLVSLLAVACGRAADAFEVRAEGATSAELALCGHSAPLDRTDGKFSGTLPIRCEGDGTIKIGFPNQPPVSCPIGYVTPGAPQFFSFKVVNGRCWASGT